MINGKFFVGKNQRDPRYMFDIWEENKDGSYLSVCATVPCDFFTDDIDGLFSKIDTSDDDGVECVIITAERYQELISKEGV